MEGKHDSNARTNSAIPVPVAHSTRSPEAQQSGAAQAKPTIDLEARHQMTANAAYSRAERRSVQRGYALHDWSEVKAEISGSPGQFKLGYN